MTGCTSTSRVFFVEPTDTMITLPDGKMNKFPFATDLKQNEEPKTGGAGEEISMTLPDGTPLKGFIHVYKLNMTEVEKLAVVSFKLDQEQINKLKNGHAVTVTGYSSEDRLVYKINVGLDR
jgi:uncharacterized protein YvpB